MRFPTLAAARRVPVRRAVAGFAGAVVVAAALPACSFITGVPSVSRVELSVTPLAIAPGEAVQASGAPIGGNGSPVSHPRRQLAWRSSNDSVATVTAGGLIQGVSPGRARITASSDGKTATVEITVRPTPVKQVVISSRAPIVRLSPSVTGLLGVTVLDTAGRALGNRPPSWTSLDPAVATVTSVGVVSPRAVGSARIVASVDTGLAPAAGRVADTVTLRVTVTPVSSIRITQQNVTMYRGDALRFTATVVDSLNSEVTDRRVVWTTNGGAYISLDSLTGTATAVSSGPAFLITASVQTVENFPNTDSRAAQTQVQVLEKAVSARVLSNGTPVSAITLRAGASQQLNLLALDAFGNRLPNRQFRVTSDTPNVVASAPTPSVPENYTVTAGAAGSATISVQPLDVSGNPQGTPATFTVTVTP
jgi:uncharacterized protein YjdB